MWTFIASFIFLSVVCFLVYLFTANSTQQSSGGDGFRRFQRTFLTVYLMAQGNIQFSLIHVRCLNLIVIAL